MRLRKQNMGDASGDDNICKNSVEAVYFEFSNITQNTSDMCKTFTTLLQMYRTEHIY